MDSPLQATNLFLPFGKFEGNICSFVVKYFVGLARELEVILIDEKDDGCTATCSLKLLDKIPPYQKEKDEYERALARATQVLASFGIFLHDMRTPVLSVFMSKLIWLPD